MELQNAILLLLAGSGFISMAKLTLNLIIWIWKMFIRPSKNLLQYGSWALITGPTDGIGKVFAFELASKGLNLVLVGRNPLKLDATCNEIRNLHGEKVEIKQVVLDFAKCSGEEVDIVIGDAIRGLDIGILVNNAGISNSYPMYFHEMDLELTESMIMVNIEGVNRVTRAVLPCLLRKKKGAIVNIGSGSSVYVPSYPLFSIYAPTKSYIAMFSRSISLEYKQHGIDIQCQIPGLVATKMAKIKKPSLFVPSAEVYGRAGVRWIGYEHICVPYWSHAVQKFILKAIPDAWLGWYLLKSFLGWRVRALKKEPTKLG